MGPKSILPLPSNKGTLSQVWPAQSGCATCRVSPSLPPPPPQPRPQADGRPLPRPPRRGPAHRWLPGVGGMVARQGLPAPQLESRLPRAGDAATDLGRAAEGARGRTAAARTPLPPVSPPWRRRPGPDPPAVSHRRLETSRALPSRSGRRSHDT